MAYRQRKHSKGNKMGKVFFVLSSMWFLFLGLWFSIDEKEIQASTLFVLCWVCYATFCILRAIEAKRGE